FSRDWSSDVCSSDLDVLTATYSGFPHTLYFPMAMGETAGYCIRLSQNNRFRGTYPPFVQGVGQVHIALMGDPTLRMFPVRPASRSEERRVGKECRWR